MVVFTQLCAFSKPQQTAGTPRVNCSSMKTVQIKSPRRDVRELWEGTWAQDLPEPLMEQMFAVTGTEDGLSGKPCLGREGRSSMASGDATNAGVFQISWI